MAYVAVTETGMHTTELADCGRVPGSSSELERAVRNLEQRAWVTDSARLGLEFVMRCGSRILRGC